MSSFPEEEHHICKFCNLQLRKSTHFWFVLDWWICDSCQVRYNYVNGFRYSWIMYTRISDNRIGEAFVSPQSITFYVIQDDQFNIDNYKGPSKVIRKFSLEEMPNLTPKNFNAKIKTILVFS
jgi:hypothetical protein